MGLWELYDFIYRHRHLNEGLEPKIKTRKSACVGLCHMNKLKRLEEMIKRNKA